MDIVSNLTHINVILPIAQDRNLTRTSMLIFAHIYNLKSSGKDIFASNALFQKITNVHIQKIQEALSALEKLQYIERYQIGRRRYIKVLKNYDSERLADLENEATEENDTNRKRLPSLTANGYQDNRKRLTYNKDNNKDYKKGSPTELKTENNEQFPKEKELPEPSKTDDLKQHTESKAYSDEKAQQNFKEKFGARKVTYDEMFKLCQDFWHPKQRVVTVNVWEKWLEEEFDYKYEYKDSEKPTIPNHQRKGYYKNKPETHRFVPPVDKTQETLQEVVKNRETAHSSKLGGLYRKLKEKTDCSYRHMGEFIEAYKNGRLTESEKQILMQV